MAKQWAYVVLRGTAVNMNSGCAIVYGYIFRLEGNESAAHMPKGWRPDKDREDFRTWKNLMQ